MRIWKVRVIIVLVKIWKAEFRLITLFMIPSQHLPKLARQRSSMNTGQRNIWKTTWRLLINGILLWTMMLLLSKLRTKLILTRSMHPERRHKIFSFVNNLKTTLTMIVATQKVSMDCANTETIAIVSKGNGNKNWILRGFQCTRISER